MSFYDFYMYLKYIEFSPENLEFYVWYALGTKFFFLFFFLLPHQRLLTCNVSLGSRTMKKHTRDWASQKRRRKYSAQLLPTRRLQIPPLEKTHVSRAQTSRIGIRIWVGH